MILLTPFKNHSASGQAGNMLIITGLIASAVAVAGGKVMLDRSTAQRKANQMAQSMKQAKEIPGSAAMIAKALISIPPNVAANKVQMWTADCILEHHIKPIPPPTNCAVKAASNTQILPLIYPIPYVSGAVGSPAQPANKVDKTVNPPTGANWKTFVSDGSSAKVVILTNDSTRAKAQDVNSAINDEKLVTGGNETLKRTESLVTYSFRNCDSAGISKPSFTGRYCASAEISSQNYASNMKGSNTQSGENKAVAELGVIEPPPAPTCGAISTPGNVKVRPGDAFSLEVNATGVALGYHVKYGATELLRRDMVSLPWNSPRTSALHTIAGIPTDPVKSALGALIASGINQATFEVVLQGVDSSKSCPVVVTMPGPVSCVPNSFTVTRTGDDLRTCQMSLQKDSGEGIITGITVGGQTFTGPAAAFSGSSWSGTMPCSEDAQTLTATLTRNVFGAVSTSTCSPSRTVPELAADCVANSLDGGRDPSDLLKCSISLKRDKKSHSVVTVNTTPAFLAGSGTWSTVINNDGSRNWQGVISPCPAGSVTVTASLTRGSTTDSCGSKTISGVEPAKCNGPPTGVRNQSNPAECKLSVTKFPSSGRIKHVTINGTNQPSSGNYPSLGAWGAGDNWTSPWLACPLTATAYSLSLVGLDDVPSSCGSFTMPVASYTLTTTVSGSGSISKSPNTATYNHGSTVILTAVPLVGHSFVNWGGACSGASPTCTVTMDNNKSVVANFVINTHTLTTLMTGSGTVARSPVASSYNHGSTVTLTAAPSVGYSFANWSGACSGASPTCTVTMDNNKSVVANFAINTYTLTTTTTGSGSISRSPNTATYNHGSTVTLTATPSVGHRFVNWGGACSGASTPCTVTMDNNKSVVANFAPVVPPACTISAQRTQNNLTQCNVMITRGVNSGPIDTVTVNGLSAGGGSWSGSTYTVQQYCPLAGINFSAMASNMNGGANCGQVAIPGQCTQAVSGYTPETVNCSISINGGGGWANQNEYITRENRMINQNAKWIAPNQRVSNYCPAVSTSQLLMYVSNFTTTGGTVYNLEYIIDNLGEVFVWKNGDPNDPNAIAIGLSGCQAGTLDDSKCKRKKQLTLVPNTRYSLVITLNEAQPQAIGNASGVVMTIHDSNSAVVKSTASDNTWCIFRKNSWVYASSAEAEVKSFVPAVAGCRSCFRGIAP